MSNAIQVTYYLLSEDDAVTDIVSDRIYHNVARQGAAYPFVVFSGITRAESPTQDFDSAIDTHRIQIDIFAEDTSQASGIATLSVLEQAIRRAMSRVTGTVDGILVNGIQPDGEGDEYDDVLKIHRKRLDYHIRLTR